MLWEEKVLDFERFLVVSIAREWILIKNPHVSFFFRAPRRNFPAKASLHRRLPPGCYGVVVAENIGF